MLKKIFPARLWTRPTIVLWCGALLTILYFYFLWCFDSTFTSFSKPLTWINALLMATVLTLPQAVLRWRHAQEAILCLLALWLEANVMYFRTYFGHIPLGSYALAGNLADFGESVLDSMRWRDFGFVAIIAAAIALSRGKNPAPTKADRWIYASYIAVLGLASWGQTRLLGGWMHHWHEMTTANFFTTRVPQFSLPGAMAHDAIVSSPVFTAELKKDVDDVLGAVAPLPPLPDSLGTRDNLVLILCESLESWPIGLELEGKEVTPVLNSLVADSSTLYAPQVLTQIGNGRSMDAQLLYNAGMLPMESDVYSFECETNRYFTLNQALGELRGARSYLLTVDKPVVWNQEVIAKAFGIDTLIAREDWRKEEMIGVRAKIGDKAFARQIKEKMERGDIWPHGENAFVQIVTYSGHNPFNLPEKYDSLRLQGNYPQLLHDYIATAHYTDGALGTLIGYLKSRPDYDRTLVVIVGDHEGLASYRAPFHKAYDFVDPRPMTPLIVLNSPVAGRHDGVIGEVDVYPTVLQLMGLTDYPWHGLGRSILDPAYVSPDADPDMARKRRTSDAILRFDLLR